MLYGIENWGTILNKPSYVAKLLKIQGIFLLQITRAARATSNEALQAITGILPTHFKRAISSRLQRNALNHAQKVVHIYTSVGVTKKF